MSEQQHTVPCSQAATIKAIQERLRNGREDFQEFRGDIKKLLERTARIEADLKTVTECLDAVDELTIDVARLKEKARNWGLIAGAAAALVINVILIAVRAWWS